jgi:hypothetical protein
MYVMYNEVYILLERTITLVADQHLYFNLLRTASSSDNKLVLSIHNSQTSLVDFYS